MGTRGPSYQSLSVADDRHERSKKESATRQQARLRCGFLLLCPLLPAVIFLLVLDGGTSSSNAWKPSPRKEVAGWRPAHQAYTREIRERAKDLRVVFYGDSITESWRGTSRLKPVPRTAGIPEVWNHTIARVYGHKAAAYGISGDYTKHLMWRLKHGELTKEMKPEVVVVLIGTNDLSECELMQDDCHLDERASSEVSDHVLDIAKLVHMKLPEARVVLHALMPRASRFIMVEKEDPAFYEQPSLFSEPIAIINSALKAAAGRLDWATYLDCSDAFLTKDKTRIDAEMMPDGLHPGRAGAEKWADCLLPTLEELDPRWGNWAPRPDDVGFAASAAGAAPVDAPAGDGASGAAGGGNTSERNVKP